MTYNEERSFAVSKECNICLSDCDNTLTFCMKACKGGYQEMAACGTVCLAAYGIKQDLCYPPCPRQFSIRNGSIYYMVFLIQRVLRWGVYQVGVQVRFY